MYGAANITLMTRSVLLENEIDYVFADKHYGKRQGEAEFCYPLVPLAKDWQTQ